MMKYRSIMDLVLLVCLATLVHGEGGSRGRRESKFLRRKVSRNLQRLRFRGSNPTFKLPQCEGDCDKDLDCVSGLVCFQRNAGVTDPVPGCSGTDTTANDYCIDPADLKTPQPPGPSPTPAPAASPPSPASGLQNFKLKMYWEEGYFWQEESFERKWCMRCRGGVCGVGDQIYIEACDDDGVQRFDFQYVSTDEVLIKLSGTNRCLQRSNRSIFVRNCNSNTSLQKWWAKVGQFSGDRFEISQKSASDRCVTQHHHPKSGETVITEPCSLARASDTSFWERCTGSC